MSALPQYVRIRTCTDAQGVASSQEMAFSKLQSTLNEESLIDEISVYDMRFPTSLDPHGPSDAVHTRPDFSAAYVVISVSGIPHKGYGIGFTLGRGTEVVCTAIKAFLPLVVGKSLLGIYTDFGKFWHSLTGESQLRWIGPERGAIHIAVAAVINGLWDLWGKIEGKPVWQLLSDMTPHETVSLVDWSYLSDVLTKEEAVEILQKKFDTRAERIKDVASNGYPAYVTSAGWIAYSDELIKERLLEAIGQGFHMFKMKVGKDVKKDRQRSRLIRDIIGPDMPLMMDANQCWDVNEAIQHMKQLAEFKPLWIEEPTSPDDILGHLKIAKALRPLGIGIATGEQCNNRVMFKQFLELGAMDFCQIDSTSLGGINEIIAVMLMAEKHGVPVCPHAGGVGLCEMTLHLQVFYYVAISGTKDKRMLEYEDHLHEHFVDPISAKHGNYVLPSCPGYSSEMKVSSIRDYEFPDGPFWKSQLQSQ